MTIKRVTFTWPGSKARLAPKILPFLPREGRKWIDVFCGRANVTFAALLAGFQYQTWIVNDIRTHVFLSLVKEHGDKISVPRRQDMSTADFAIWKKKTGQGDITAILLEPYLTWSGSGWAGGGPRWAGGWQTPEAYQRNLRGAAEILRSSKVRITGLDWLDCLKEEQVGAQDTCFFDPPYLGAVTQSYYPSDICPVELIAYLQKAQHAWGLTEYDQPLYLASLGEPALRMVVRPPNSSNGGMRTECLWVRKGSR
jgi:16S rRNA G966 N2-methylase RsmD